MQQFEHLHQQIKAPPLRYRQIGLCLQILLPLLELPGEEIIHGLEVKLLTDPLGQNMLVINEGSGAYDLRIDFFGQEREQRFLVPGLPEEEDGLDKTDDEIGALHMTLLAQKMNEHIMPLMD